LADNPPYVNAYGNITKTLTKIQTAAVPARFTQDFLATKLALKGGSARPVIPFLKRLGLLGSDGVPTDLYKRFRNPQQRGAAAASALKNGFAALYEINEYIHDATDDALKGVVVQATGGEPDSSTTKAIVGSFKAVREFANFAAEGSGDEGLGDPADEEASGEEDGDSWKPTVGLSYTINLNLPATSDVAVFDAIFKSLKEHLLR
jgi:hypothetical protein